MATPIEWDERGKTPPDKYTLRNLTKRLAQKDDPWSDIHRRTRSASDVEQRITQQETCAYRTKQGRRQRDRRVATTR
jgi:DNA primase